MNIYIIFVLCCFDVLISSHTHTHTKNWDLYQLQMAKSISKSSSIASSETGKCWHVHHCSVKWNRENKLFKLIEGRNERKIKKNLEKCKETIHIYLIRKKKQIFFCIYSTVARSSTPTVDTTDDNGANEIIKIKKKWNEKEEAPWNQRDFDYSIKNENCILLQCIWRLFIYIICMCMQAINI